MLSSESLLPSHPSVVSERDHELLERLFWRTDHGGPGDHKLKHIVDGDYTSDDIGVPAL